MLQLPRAVKKKYNKEEEEEEEVSMYSIVYVHSNEGNSSGRASQWPQFLTFE